MTEALTPREAAALLRCDVRLIRRAIRSGQLPALRLGRVVRISRAAIDRVLEGQPTAPEATAPAPVARRKPAAGSAKVVVR